MWIHRLTNVDKVKLTATCSNCGEVKIDKYSFRCRNKINETSRIGKYRRKYGINIEKAEIGICELCGGNTRIAYDHSHKTGKFRGWLCMKCNTALGLVNDDIELLKRMIAYLERG